MSKMEVLKSSYEDDKPQKGMRVGVIYDMIVTYLCICKFKKHYNPRYMQEYQISKIYSRC